MEFDWEYLPDDILIRFLSELELPDLVNYCKINQKTRNICELSSFWRHKILQEFPKFNPQNIPLSGMNVRETYFELLRTKVHIPLYINSILTESTTIMTSPYYGWDKYVSDLIPIIRSTIYMIIFKKNGHIQAICVSDSARDLVTEDLSDNHNTKLIVLSQDVPDTIYIIDPEGQNYYYPSLKLPVDEILSTDDINDIENTVNTITGHILNNERIIRNQRNFVDAMLKIRSG